MAFAQIDPKQVIITMGGSPISGFPDGTYISIAFDADQYSKKTGADGLTTRVKSNNYSGAITITLQQSSSGNDLLNSFWNSDRQGNLGVAPLFIKDFQGRTMWSAQNAWVRKLPDQAFSLETENREWIIDCDELVGQVGGNQ